MERKLKIGGAVVFIDEYRREHDALVTAIHGEPEGTLVTHELQGSSEVVELDPPKRTWPCINLLYVSPNEACQDQYGRQIERPSSVVHQGDSTAVGFCYRFADEETNREAIQPTVS